MYPTLKMSRTQSHISLDFFGYIFLKTDNAASKKITRQNPYRRITSIFFLFFYYATHLLHFSNFTEQQNAGVLRLFFYYTIKVLPDKNFTHS